MTAILTKRQLRAAETGESLLTAARDVFEQRGYAGTTVGAITEAAGCAHGTFYLHFRNKEDAFAKVIDHVAGQMFEQARAPVAGDPYQSLRLATRGYLEAFKAHTGLWRCLLEGMQQSPAIEQLWREVRQPFFDRITGSLDRLAARGSIRPMDTRLAAHALGSMVEWMAFSTFELGQPTAEEASFEGVVAILTDLWFHAVMGASQAAAVIDR
jgi:AcrR family transcriptional regulator